MDSWLLLRVICSIRMSKASVCGSELALLFVVYGNVLLVYSRVVVLLRQLAPFELILELWGLLACN